MIYFLLSPKTGYIKIGTTTNYQERLTSLKKVYGNLELLGLADGDKSVEANLHSMFASIRVSPKHEWFHDVPHIREYIAQQTHLNIPKPPKRKNPIRQIPVSDEIAAALREFADGLGSTYDEALRLLLREVIGGENRKMAGHRLRSNIDPDFAT